MKNLILSALASTALIALATGCSSLGYKKANDTSGSLSDAAQSIDDSLQPLDSVLVALTDLVNHPGENITPQFETYRAAVTSLESAVNELNGHSQAMQKSGGDYFRNWDDQLAKIESNEIQSRSRDRKDVVAMRFRIVSKRYMDTASNLNPLMSQLIDVRTALGTDLTSGGLASVRDLIRQANADAEQVRASLVDLASDFRALGISLSPRTPAT